MFFGRFGWLEAEVAGMKTMIYRHLDDCNEGRKDSHRRFESLSEKIDENARACIDKAEGVRKDLANRMDAVLWKTLVGALGLVLALVAALLKFHPTL